MEETTRQGDGEGDGDGVGGKRKSIMEEKMLITWDFAAPSLGERQTFII